MGLRLSLPFFIDILVEGRMCIEGMLARGRTAQWSMREMGFGMDSTSIHFEVDMKAEIGLKYFACVVLTALMAICCSTGTNRAGMKHRTTNNSALPHEHLAACETKANINEFDTSELTLSDDEIREVVGGIWAEYSSGLISRIKKTCKAGRKCSESKFNLLLQLNSSDKVLELTETRLVSLHDGEQTYEVAVGNNALDVLVGKDSLETSFAVFEFAVLDYRRRGDDIALVVFFRKNVSAQIVLETASGEKPEWSGIRGAGTLETESLHECMKFYTVSGNSSMWKSSKVSCCLDKDKGETVGRR